MGCCSRCSFRCFGAWFLGVIANILFIGTICLSTYKIWPLGLTLSVVYSISLWLCIYAFHKRMEKGRSSDASHDPTILEANTTSEAPESSSKVNFQPPEQERQTSEESVTPNARKTVTSIETEGKIPFALSLIYFTAILSLAGPMVVLIAKHLIHCIRTHQSYAGSTTSIYTFWKADLEKIPPSLHAWASYQGSDYFYNDRHSGDNFFCQIRNTTFFKGAASHFNPVTKLYAVTGGLKPKPIENFNKPRMITKVTEDTLCFVADTASDYYMYQDNFLIVCGNQTDFRNVTEHSEPQSLLEFDELLWFRQNCPEEYLEANTPPDKQCLDSMNSAVVSMNTTNMTQTLRSFLVKTDNYQKYTKDIYGYGGRRHLQEDCESIMTSWQAVAGIFLTAVPIIIASARAWFKRAIPSASVTLYIGIGMVFMCVSSLMDPWEGGVPGLMIWFVFGSPVWIFACTFQLITNPKVSKPPLRWGLHTVAFCVCISLVLALLNLDRELSNTQYPMDSSDVVGEIAISICVFLLVILPLVLIGIATESMFLYIEGVVCVLAFATSQVIIYCSSDVTVAVTVSAVVVLVLVGIFWLVHKTRATLKDKLVAWILRCARHACVVSPSIEEEEVELLVNDNVEEA